MPDQDGLFRTRYIDDDFTREQPANFTDLRVYDVCLFSYLHVRTYVHACVFIFWQRIQDTDRPRRRFSGFIRD